MAIKDAKRIVGMASAKAAMIRIYTTGGSLVVSYPVESGAPNYVPVDISSLSAGMYVVRVFNSSTTIVKQ